MPRAVIADSDEDEDEDSFSLPSSPESRPPGRPVIDLTTGASSQDVSGNTSGATSSTDPAFFQSVLDEHRAAARNFASRVSAPVAYEDHGGHVPEGRESADEVAHLRNFEMNAPGTSRKVVAGLAAMAPSSATNPATQRSYGSTMARLKGSAPGLGLWDVPSSAEEAEAGTRSGAVHAPLNSISADSNGSPGDDDRRKRRLLSKGGIVETSRIETTDSQLKKAHRESLPSTMSVLGVPSSTSGQRKVSARSQGGIEEYAFGFDGGTDDTNAFSTGERQRRIDQVDELPSGMLASSHDALAPDLTNEKTVYQFEDTTMDEAADSPTLAVAVSKGPGRTRSKRRRSSSPDIISNNSPMKAKTKTSKARRTRNPAAGYVVSEEEGGPTELVEDDSVAEKAHKPRSAGKRRVMLGDEDEDSSSDASIQENYAEEDYDADFVDVPKKSVKKQSKKRGRPKKGDKIQEDDIGPEETAPRGTKKKRGRPRKPDAKNQTTQDEEPKQARRPADINDEAHDLTKDEDHERDGEQESSKDTQEQVEEEDDEGVEGQGVDEEQSEVEVNETKLALEAVESGDQSEATPAKSEQEATNKRTARPEDSRPSSLAAAIATTSKPLYRVGLSKRSRIAPLLKSLRKPSDEPPVDVNKGGKGTKKKDRK